MSDDWARPVVHWEIVARHPARLADFYRRLFNWDIGDGPVMTVTAGLGGPEPGPAGHLRQGNGGGVNLYVGGAPGESDWPRMSYRWQGHGYRFDGSSSISGSPSLIDQCCH